MWGETHPRQLIDGVLPVRNRVRAPLAVAAPGVSPVGAKAPDLLQIGVAGSHCSVPTTRSVPATALQAPIAYCHCYRISLQRALGFGLAPGY